MSGVWYWRMWWVVKCNCKDLMPLQDIWPLCTNIEMWAISKPSVNRDGSRISRRWGAKTKRGRQPNIQSNFPENCIKMKKIRAKGYVYPNFYFVDLSLVALFTNKVCVCLCIKTSRIGSKAVSDGVLTYICIFRNKTANTDVTTCQDYNSRNTRYPHNHEVAFFPSSQNLSMILKIKIDKFEITCEFLVCVIQAWHWHMTGR